MGLAASQARFLGLTARQSNVEFQGQQVNQARTALSNEVNRLYDRYNELTVPVPPAQADYTKTTSKLLNYFLILLGISFIILGIIKFIK